jgi:hypothetical protein
MKKPSLPALIVISVLFAGAASASYISLKTTLSSKVEGNILKVKVSAVNNGDEAAYNVQPEIRAGKQKRLARKREELGIAGTYQAEERFVLGFKNPGQYPLLLTLHYTDANQYPFSALSCQLFSYGTGVAPSDVFGRLQPATFWKKGRVKLALKNRSEAQLPLSVFLALPRELSCAKESMRLDIPARSERTAEFEVENFSALSGSNYQVFAIAEYEREGRHYTNITPGTLKIVESRTILGVDYVYVLGFLVILVVVFLSFQFVPFLFKK